MPLGDAGNSREDGYGWNKKGREQDASKLEPRDASGLEHDDAFAHPRFAHEIEEPGAHAAGRKLFT
jgi:hypothetical protein